jgi:hypothetical protein
MRKLNCWEFKECGREPGGSRSKDLGVCPAASDTSSDGKNNGENGGRLCWAIAGTLCRGISQGIYAHRQVSCMICEVFIKVAAQERPNLTLLDSGRLDHAEDLEDGRLCCGRINKGEE